jgi:hypothetical protein
MQKLLLILAALFLTIPRLNAQTNFEISIPETYELSNIILALTDYGKADQWEVQKNSNYYNEVMKFFEPVKNHPLLKKVNYSRDLWEDYLSFRTDAVAYKFNNENKLVRINDFYANDGFKPFDSSLSLINDFIQQSNFRQFYSSHKTYYNSIVQQYENYYMLKETKEFLRKLSGIIEQKNKNSKYEVVLSPLVGRMNCHRNIDTNTIADFPSLSPALINENKSEISNQAERVAEIHTVFTEMDHGYVNPITDKYADLVRKSFDNKYWDINSGYEDLDCFNEYMTWAVYDLFTQKYFPKYADSINIQWHYQNASRGFFASNLFAKQFLNAYNESKDKTLSSIYPELLKWTMQNQNKNELPKINIASPRDTIFTLSSSKIIIPFSINMDTSAKQVSFIVSKIEGNRNTGKDFVTITNNQFKWIDAKTLQIDNEIKYDEFSIIFNWWGCKFPLTGANKIFLSPYSFVNFKK